MVETLQRSGLWHIVLAEHDLVSQAGLKQEDFEQDFGFFRYKGRPVILSHQFNEHLVVSMEGEDDADLQQLIAGFSTVVGYRPFCKYLLLCLKEGERNPLPSLPTYEWDKLNPASRYEELIGKPTTQGLVRL